MGRDDRLGLVKQALAETIRELDDDEIHDTIEDLRPSGSTNLEAGLRTGFGMDNFNDATMEQVADQGDGFYA